MNPISIVFLAVTVFLVLRDTSVLFTTSDAERRKANIQFVLFSAGALLFALLVVEISKPVTPTEIKSAVCQDTVAPALQLWPSMYTPVADDVTVTPIHRKH